MSRKDQTHKHTWQRRLRDWFILPHTNMRPLGHITSEDLAKHVDPHDCWIAVDGVVYDVTRFLQHHPGGPKTILMCAGREAGEEFARHHARVTPTDVLASYIVGNLVGASPAAPPAASPQSSGPQVAASGAIPPRQPSAEEADNFAAVFDEVLGGRATGTVPKSKVAEFLSALDATLTDDDIARMLSRVNGDTVSRDEFARLL